MKQYPPDNLAIPRAARKECEPNKVCFAKVKKKRGTLSTDLFDGNDYGEREQLATNKHSILTNAQHTTHSGTSKRPHGRSLGKLSHKFSVSLSSVTRSAVEPSRRMSRRSGRHGCSGGRAQNHSTALAWLCLAAVATAFISIVVVAPQDDGLTSFASLAAS